MAYQTSQGLASLGRNGDSVLVHMNPTEVAGLQSLAMSQGGSLTINPHTGLPEAFSLGNFFKSLLPVAAGMAMPASAGLWAGIAAGAATGALTSKDKLMGAITGGLGGYSGFGLGQGLRAAAGNAASNIVPQGVAESTVGAANMGNIGMANTFNTGTGATLGQAGTYSQALNPIQYTGAQSMMTDPTILNAQNAAQTMTAAGGGPGSSIVNSAASPAEQALSNFGSNASQLKQGFGNVISGDQAAIDAYTKGIGAITGMGALAKTALPIGGAALGGLEPSDLYGDPINMDEAKKKQAYDPNRSLNLSNDTGLRLYAVGGPIQATTGSSIYGNPDGTIAQQTPKDDYGIGRLNNLASQQAQTQAQTYGYAMGGPVSFADGGDSNKEDAMGLPSLSPDMSMNPNTGPNNSAMLQSVMGAMQPMQGMQGNTSMTQSQAPDQSNDSLIAKVTANLKADPNYQPTNPIEASIVKQIKGTDQMQQGQPSQQGLGSIAPSQPMAPSYNPSVAMGPTYFAGINAPRGMARGGYLDGQGDGMSDSIPATIEGKQPARLADGEFVVPADVVSHIGNGSSKAGSQRLYSMLDKVRKARTGNTKQGKQINPNKYMPA